MVSFGRWWWILPVALVAVLLKGVLLTAWVAGQVEDAATQALASEGLGRVEFVEIDGVDGFGGAGLNVVLEGPAEDQLAAVAAVEAREEVDNVIYRVLGDRTTDQESWRSSVPGASRGPVS